MTDPHSKSKRSCIGRLARTSLALLVGLLLVELVLRFALFHDSPIAERLGRELRSPDHFAHRYRPEYWKLQSHLQRATRKPTPMFDPNTGWSSKWLRPDAYQHQHLAEDETRRPVLLFGDSFAACVRANRTRWQDVHAESDLAGEQVLLNCGVGGFGLDQAWVLYNQVIDSLAERDPIIVIAPLVDDDFDRSMLPFRGWAKCRFEPQGDHQLKAVHVPLSADLDAWMKEEGLGIPSYLWAWTRTRADWLPTFLHDPAAEQAAYDQRVRDLNRRILRAWFEDLEARGLDACGLLFYGRRSILAENDSWRGAFARGHFERAGLPVRSMRDHVRERTGADQEAVQALFLKKGQGKGHLNDEGVRAVYPVLHDAIRAAQ